MSQILCIEKLPKYYCTMQNILYQTLDLDNVAYLRHYLAFMPGIIPILVHEYLDLNKLHIEIFD